MDDNAKKILGVLAAGGVLAALAKSSKKRSIVDEVDYRLERSRKGFIDGKSPDFVVREFAQAQELIHSPEFSGSPNNHKKDQVTQKFIDLGTEFSR